MTARRVDGKCTRSRICYETCKHSKRTGVVHDEVSHVNFVHRNFPILQGYGDPRRQLTFVETYWP
jgi:hypothetical protein